MFIGKPYKVGDKAYDANDNPIAANVSTPNEELVSPNVPTVRLTGVRKFLTGLLNALTTAKTFISKLTNALTAWLR